LTASLALIAAVFAASLLGSFHCAGMCGAFVAIACGSPDGAARGWRRALNTQAAYHGGRLLSYTLLGVAAGATGSMLNLAGALAGVRPIATALAGATIATFGVISLLRLRGANIGKLNVLPASWTRLVARASGVAMNRPPAVRALMIGLLTTLLPCGWLYAFTITAAGTASPLLGGVAMIAFWAGTLPALAAVGVGAKALLGPVGRKMPVVTAVALVVIGLFTLTGRASLDPASLAHRAVDHETHSCCEAK
jgi:sulfite exporter TauE/SafE